MLAPSERSNRQRGCRHKLLTDWARQAALQLSRWLPGRRIVFIGDIKTENCSEHDDHTNFAWFYIEVKYFISEKERAMAARA